MSDSRITDLAAALIAGVSRYELNCHSVELESDPQGIWLHETDVLAALTTALDGVDERAGAVLQGVTLGPWLTDSGDVFADGEDFPLAMCLASRPDDARFIAWCREGVPALLARIAAQEAQIKGLEAKVAEVTSDRAYIIGANAGWEAAVEQGEATPAAAAMLARADAAEAEVEKLRGLLCLADEALMQSHGCFPLDRTNEREIFLNDACTAIRKVTGDDYNKRKELACAALTTEADNG